VSDVAVRVADRVRIWCPGCDTVHEVRVEGEFAWAWNRELTSRITLTPSILAREFQGKNEYRRCHSYVAAGRIQFLDDCSHALKGTTHPLQPVSSWRFGASD
jgi:Family of unknown function (DUF6527)